MRHTCFRLVFPELNAISNYSLVELIVLNVGRSAGILDIRLFSMFVLHALVLTFMTTPLVLLWYPPKHRGNNDSTPSNGQPQQRHTGGSSGGAGQTFVWKSKLAVAFNRVEHLPALMSLVQLLRKGTMSTEDSDSEDGKKPSEVTPTPTPQTTIHALRLVELTERTSAVLRSQEASEPALVARDPLLTVVRSLARIQQIVVHSALRVVSPDEFPQMVTAYARIEDAEMIVIPWGPAKGNASEGAISQASSSVVSTVSFNPFEGVFGSGDRANFVRRVFAESSSDVALFIDRSSLLNLSEDPVASGLESGSDHHIFLPFFGGADDRLALSFVVQLCAYTSNTATVIRFTGTEYSNKDSRDSIDDAKLASQAEQIGAQDTVYGNMTTQNRLVSDTADNLLWSQCIDPSDGQSKLVRGALGRINFRECSIPTPLHSMLELMSSSFRGGAAPEGTPSPVVIVGRNRRMPHETRHRELLALVSERGFGPDSMEMAKTVGDTAAAVIVGKINANLIVMQAAIAATDRA